MNKNYKGKLLSCLVLAGVVLFSACSKDNALVEETPDTKDTVYFIKQSYRMNRPTRYSSSTCQPVMVISVV